MIEERQLREQAMVSDGSQESSLYTVKLEKGGNRGKKVRLLER